VTRGKGVRPFGEHVDDLIPVYFAEITSVTAKLTAPEQLLVDRWACW
jgi:hypothetical protein